ncbi:hypothetical protein ABZ897_49570 [Nonomuraea sp. NPDC046802]|uniref:alpha/beta fold hydrolase n=1 Tax=Nonomuraea sp. NPDC046802 TaxID=3154919 RepID=UPI0033E73010
MVLITGAFGVADVHRAVLPHLAAQHTIAVYARRGFSRSHLDGSQDYHRRLETDADDVRHLIEHLDADRVIPTVGRRPRGRPCYEATVELSRRLARDVVELPGGHIGSITDTPAFAGAHRHLAHDLVSHLVIAGGAARPAGG